MRAGEDAVMLDPAAVRVLSLVAGANIGACASQLAGEPGAFFEEQPSAALNASTSALALCKLLSPRYSVLERTSIQHAGHKSLKERPAL